MKTSSFALATLALASLTGCHHRSPEYAHEKWCDSNPQSVEIYIGQEPARPYRVIGVVDGSFGVGAGRRMKKMQIRACRLGADAVIDQANNDADIVREHTVSTPWGTFTEQRVKHRPAAYGSMLAIQFTDGAPESSPRTVPVSPAMPSLPDAPDAPEPPDAPVIANGQRVQIQTSGGIEIHAPSVEFRQEPQAPQGPPARLPPAQPAEPNDE